MVLTFLDRCLEWRFKKRKIRFGYERNTLHPIAEPHPFPLLSMLKSLVGSSSPVARSLQVGPCSTGRPTFFPIKFRYCKLSGTTAAVCRVKLLQYSENLSATASFSDTARVNCIQSLASHCPPCDCKNSLDSWGPEKMCSSLVHNRPFTFTSTFTSKQLGTLCRRYHTLRFATISLMIC